MAPARDKTFGSWIRKLRRERGMSQRRLAQKVGIDFTYLSKLENNAGQSPGDDLIRRLAVELGEDADELLALAGKVPVDELRARAKEDPEFARALRRLPDVSDSRITGLTAAPTEMGEITDVRIVATFKRSPGVSSLRLDFVANQDEYLVGVVGSGAHRDRLREAKVPIHDIYVTYPEQVEGPRSTDSSQLKYDISVEYRDGDGGDYLQVGLEKVSELSPLWRPQAADDRFPLVVLRAGFPAQEANQVRRIALRYDFTLSDSEEGYWFWTASRAMFVSTISIDVTDLEQTCECKLVKFLPNVESEEDRGGKHVVYVSDWLQKGHGITLSWWPMSE